MNRQEAAGFIETHGLLPAVEAADVCLKTAHVRLTGMERAGAGLVTVIVRGDVGATKAAVEAATIAADRLGTVVSTHVIARPVDELDAMLSGLIQEDSTPVAEEQPAEAPAEVAAEVKAPAQAEAEPLGSSTPTAEQLRAQRTVELRNLARQLPDFAMSKQQIKFAKKRELVEAILSYYERTK